MEEGLFFIGKDISGDSIIINLMTVQQIIKSDRDPCFISFMFATHGCDIVYKTKAERDIIFTSLMINLVANRYKKDVNAKS
jgi:hypothetical protein